MPLHNKQIYNRNLKRKSHSVLDKGYTLKKAVLFYDDTRNRKSKKANADGMY